MNLITRFTLAFVLVAAVVFVGGGFISYQVVKKEIQSEERRFLKSRYKRLLKYLETRTAVDGFTRNKTILEPVTKDTPLYGPIFSDTLVQHAHFGKMENQIKLESVVEIAGQRYHIIQFDLIVESEDIIASVTKSMLITFLILLFSTVLIALFISYYMLAPFRILLTKIKNFSITDKEPIQFTISKVKEFNKINHFLLDMTSKIISDYQLLKEFTENTSHEFQTPIAIIQGKLENMLEENNLSQSQMNSLIEIQSTLSRLSKMTTSLSLLTKIDNHEFNNTEKLNLSEILGVLLKEYEELLILKKITLSMDLAKDIEISGDRVLVQIMLTNLITNAIRHNIESGKINLTLSSNTFVIWNSGLPTDVNPLDLFNRFEKLNQHINSLGLGLSIVKKIVENYNYNISYQVEEDRHILTLKF
jgi:signal transduction histidine kinase|tara:strand:- start:2754 stop:4007 length:1254 start_codon:yes stop_codon:yes gene_type:complete